MARRFLTPDTVPQAAADGTGADAVPPAPHVVQWHLHGAAVKVAIAGNVVVAALFFAAIIWRVFFTGTAQEGAAVSPQVQEESAHGAAEGALFSSSATSTPPCAPPRSGGLREADLLALPVYVHGSSADEAAVGGAGAEGTSVECAVCLGELRDGETGRVLPRCGHRFHAECVDRWFRSHVTCPLCRAVVAADGGSGKFPKVQPGV
ncbi:E3 ubiquitin-protein ligase EL5-like [Miscanthus floridulus]|uniref:E3 ubiquitin-protein ligase EL5-like n=1 Tax=Miscanthus floridulus TaxID=154761 RepID=UPI00345AE05D